MTTEEELIQVRLLKARTTAKKEITCLETKLEKIAEHLEGLARIAKRKTSLPELDQDGNIRVGFKPFVAHTDQEIVQSITDLRDWKQKLTALNKQIQDSGIDPED